MRCIHNPNKECSWRTYCENYTCEMQKVDPETCPHSDTSIVGIDATINCETTAKQCDLCGKIISEPKTECR